jgi:hypothetical protein
MDAQRTDIGNGYTLVRDSSGGYFIEDALGQRLRTGGREYRTLLPWSLAVSDARATVVYKQERNEGRDHAL